MTFCPDCAEDGRQCSLVLDADFQGFVCPRCERVYQPGKPPEEKLYATKKACFDRIRRDEKTRAQAGVYRKALVENIMRHGHHS